MVCSLFCTLPELLGFSPFVVHLGRMRIYFDNSQRNGTPYLRNTFQKQQIYIIDLHWLIKDSSLVLENIDAYVTSRGLWGKISKYDCLTIL